jgi:exopolysaccharide biosynthesis polyprenyl glycosylphosphotransferase
LGKKGGTIEGYRHVVMRLPEAVRAQSVPDGIESFLDGKPADVHEEDVQQARSEKTLLPSEARPGARLHWGLILVVSDLCAIFAAFFVATVVSAALSRPRDFDMLAFAASLPLWILVLHLHGLYDRDQKRLERPTADDLAPVFHAVTLGTWLVFAVLTVVEPGAPGVGWFVVFWICASSSILLGRAVSREALRRRPSYVQNAVIVGAGDVGQLFARKLLKHPEYGIRLLGFVDGQPGEIHSELREYPVLGGPDELPGLVDRLRIERVLISYSRDRNEDLLALIPVLNERQVHVDIVPPLFEAVGPVFRAHTVEGLPLMGIEAATRNGVSLAFKRLIDVLVAVSVLVLTAPLFAVIALLIRRESPGPVFFRQVRVGAGMREFTMLKFRTMHLDTDDAPHRAYISEMMDRRAVPQSNRLYKLDRAADVTRIGSLLRRTSLDELPQLINVVRGEMSLVGPRPCLPYEVAHFEPHHFERFRLPAGCTGLWQVTARARSTFREALDLDVAYVRGWSLGLDFRLLLRTPMALLRRSETA